MAEVVLWMIALLLSAVATGVAFSHVLEVPGKRRLPAEVAVAVQQQLYVGYRTPAAIMELGALLSTLAVVPLAWDDGAACGLTLAALAALLGALLVFVFVTDRANRRILAWRVEDLPPDWARVRARWEVSHGVRSMLFLAAVGLLAAALHA
jgi:hypothetical protein